VLPSKISTMSKNKNKKTPDFSARGY